jgi:Cytochrome c554 and c-prime
MAQEAPPPPKHIGVGGCSASTCHGMATDDKKKRYIFQDEYQVWKRSDKHAKAYQSLLEPLGKRIAENLGIGAPEKAQLCLSCHSDNIPRELQDKFFHVEDGVGCEACHGGAERWLAPHIGPNVSDADALCPADRAKDDEAEHKSHAALAALGLYPTDKPFERAERCMDCHLGVIGDENRFVTHRMMGAGHPRMSFELQTFSQRQPAHFRIDCKYRARKEAYQGVKFWAIGQAVALARLANSVADPKRTGDGRFPELVFFDCQACHHSEKELRWEKREDTGVTEPGLPYLNDANAVMLVALPAKVAPDLRQKLEEDVRALHKALSAGAGNTASSAKAVADTARELAARFDSHVFTPEEMTEMLRALGKTGEGADAGDYGIAEQVTWGVAAILDTMCQNSPHDDKLDDNCRSAGARDGGSEHRISGEQYLRLNAALQQCYEAILKEETYDPANFHRAAAAVLQAVPAW